MSVSRRSLLGGLGGAGSSLSGALIAARGREAAVAEAWPEEIEATLIPPPQDGEIRISSNENPLGPGPRAVAAIERTFDESNRYPMNSRVAMQDLKELVAGRYETAADNVVLGSGSSEILKKAAQAYTSPERAYVSAAPSYRDSRGIASYQGAELREPPVDEQGRIPLDAMAEAVDGAGLVYVCNPNNPTGTVHGADAIAGFVEIVRQRNPDAVILIDEAYHEYTTDPSYETAVPMALETPNVLVTRTFSKCYGMAGMRIGYALGHPELMADLAGYILPFNTNVLGLAAAHETLQDEDYVPQERARNEEVKEFTVSFFEDAGYTVWDSQTNFFFVELGRPAADFRSACAEHDVRVGRDFPPLEDTHCRISLGTMEEMERAVEVFRQVLEA